MINDIEKLKNALENANNMCRTFHSIVERKGDQTNWDTLKNQLNKSLSLQHQVMYPENYDKLTASEAVYGFGGWISSMSRGINTTDCALIADLVNKFVKENKLSDPRDGWHQNLIHPSGECSHINNTLNIGFIHVTNDTVKNTNECKVTSSAYEIPLNEKVDNWRFVPVKKSEVDLHQTTDAQVWATEFCKTLEKLYRVKVDEGWIVGWMTNAIMCGWDHQSWKRDKEYIYILKTRGGDILKVFHWEPAEKDIREEYNKHYPDDITGGSYDIWDYIRLFRWSRSYGLTEMSGSKSDTRYEWKAVNQ